jgi:molybdenum cofactor cytidylyltransferase
LLAAGGSSRLGEPKQLLRYNGKSLLRHSVATASSSSAEVIIVVLGAEADSMRNELMDERALIVVNESWKEGMAGSLVSGVQQIAADESLRGVIIMMCDQPYVTTELLNELLKAHENTGRPIVTSSYDGVPGPPAFFHRSYFPQLLQLKGDSGARKIVEMHPDDTILIPFREGNADIDTREDYEALIASIEKT